MGEQIPVVHVVGGMLSLIARWKGDPLGEITRRVDAAFAAPGIVLDGVRSLSSIADAVSRAWLEPRL